MSIKEKLEIMSIIKVNSNKKTLKLNKKSPNPSFGATSFLNPTLLNFLIFKIIKKTNIITIAKKINKLYGYLRDKN